MRCTHRITCTEKKRFTFTTFFRSAIAAFIGIKHSCQTTSLLQDNNALRLKLMKCSESDSAVSSPPSTIASTSQSGLDVAAAAASTSSLPTSTEPDADDAASASITSLPTLDSNTQKSVVRKGQLSRGGKRLNRR